MRSGASKQMRALDRKRTLMDQPFSFPPSVQEYRLSLRGSSKLCQRLRRDSSCRKELQGTLKLAMIPASCLVRR